MQQPGSGSKKKLVLFHATAWIRIRKKKLISFHETPAVLVDLLLLDDLLEELEVRHVTAAPHHRAVVHLYSTAQHYKNQLYFLSLINSRQ
jgi:hypothetical protein